VVVLNVESCCKCSLPPGIFAELSSYFVLTGHCLAFFVARPFCPHTSVLLDFP